MPLYECQCEDCGYVHQELMPHKNLSSFIDELSSGDMTHVVEYESGKQDVCGTFRYKISLPNVHSASGDYPFETSPWLLPPRIVDGKPVPNIVTVNNRSEYVALLKKHNMVENETDADRLTMYESKPESNEAMMRSEVDADMKMYNHMLKNPADRKRVIRENVAKSRSLVNAN